LDNFSFDDNFKSPSLGSCRFVPLILRANKIEFTNMEIKKLRRRLGQNFLVSKRIAQKIVEFAKLNSNDIVLEIGPGKGILTEVLLEKLANGKLIAVEKDKDLVEFLKQKFSFSKNLTLALNDILKFDLSKFKLYSLRYKIVANLPYYLTSRFIRSFLQSDLPPSKMVLMVQKEVAERITAKNNQESILSINVKAYGQPKILKIVPARYFSPRPKVDSAILLIDNISKNFFKDIIKELGIIKKEDLKNSEKELIKKIEKIFFELVSRGFSNKRKLLKNNLKLKPEVFKKCNISQTSRAENLSLENWKSLLKFKLLTPSLSSNPFLCRGVV